MWLGTASNSRSCKDLSHQINTEVLAAVSEDGMQENK
jgi:hypothetical protein